MNLITKSSFCNHLSHWDLKAERELLASMSFLYLSDVPFSLPSGERPPKVFMKVNDRS